jgi:hypothetical protein
MVNKRDADVFIICLSYHFDEWIVPCHRVRRYPVGGSRWYVYTYNDKSLLGTLSKVAWDLGIRTSRDIRFSTYNLSSICIISIFALTLTIQDAYDGGQWELKASKYHNFWRFIKLVITTSLREGPFFYFYVESPPSIFIHRLRETSCHSKYNVHCPKVFIDWFIILVSLVLKLLISSRPLKLEGVLCIYVLLSHEGQAENHLYVFPYDLNTRLTFIVSFSWSFICVLSHVIIWLLSFFYQDYVFYAHVLNSFDPNAQRLHSWSRLCRCMSPQKLFLLLSFTYSRTSRS